MPVTDPVASVLMTLAGIAYGKPSAIPGYLATATILANEWSIDWIAQDVPNPVNFAYVARNATTGAHVIAIRGTYPDPFSSAYWDDASQDNPLGTMHQWPGAPPGAQVSAGTWSAFQNLIGLSNGVQSFAQAISSIPPTAEIYVTGHSLGGTLSPVIALWMAEQTPPRIPTVYSFAGLTPGNAAFAALFQGAAPLADRVWRYNNRLDTVPYGWDRIIDTRDFYQPAPQGGPLVRAAIDTMAALLVPYGYHSIGTEVVLPGTLSGTPILNGMVAYLLENLHQHLPDTYLALLGAPALPFTIGFGALVADRIELPDRRFAPARLPVTFRIQNA